MPKKKFFWLSFADEDGFKGVSIVAVDEADRATAHAVVLKQHGQVRPNADWYAAAIRKAWLLGINPGGQVGISELSARPPDLPVDCALTPEQIDRYVRPQ